MKKSIFLLAIMVSMGLIAEDNEVKELHDQSCLACHLVTHNKEFYTRDKRKMKTYAKLEAQVSRCVANFDIGWFPEDQQSVVSYLNKHYYHFNKPRLNKPRLNKPRASE